MTIFYLDLFETETLDSLFCVDRRFLISLHGGEFISMLPQLGWGQCHASSDLKSDVRVYLFASLSHSGQRAFALGRFRVSVLNCVDKGADLHSCKVKPFEGEFDAWMAPN